jgi:hypothetical protein
MHRANRYITSLFLTAALAAPVALMAIPAPQEDHNQNRVYDKEHKDYHNWDDNENKAWGQYLNDNHKSSHEYSKANKKERRITGITATLIQIKTSKVTHIKRKNIREQNTSSQLSFCSVMASWGYSRWRRD